MLVLEAVYEAHVAAEVIAGELQGNKELAAAAFNAHAIPSVGYTDPEVASPKTLATCARHQGQEGPITLDCFRPGVVRLIYAAVTRVRLVSRFKRISTVRPTALAALISVSS